MRGPRARVVSVSCELWTILERFARSKTASVTLVERCRIILLTSDGMATMHAASELAWTDSGCVAGEKRRSKKPRVATDR